MPARKNRARATPLLNCRLLCLSTSSAFRLIAWLMNRQPCKETGQAFAFSYSTNSGRTDELRYNVSQLAACSKSISAVMHAG
jgi:hypothetical protein